MSTLEVCKGLELGGRKFKFCDWWARDLVEMGNIELGASNKAMLGEGKGGKTGQAEGTQHAQP